MFLDVTTSPSFSVFLLVGSIRLINRKQQSALDYPLTLQVSVFLGKTLKYATEDDSEDKSMHVSVYSTLDNS